MNRENEKAMFANRNVRKLPIYMARGFGNSNDWTMLVRGAGAKNSRFGEQPMIGIKRDEALKLKNNFKFKSVPHGYEGEIPEDIYHLAGEGKAFVRPSLSVNQKSNLKNWVSKNPDWTTIDDLPRDLFYSLVKDAGGDIDKRVKIQVSAINYMKSLKQKPVQVAPEPERKKDYFYVQELHKQLHHTKINGFPFFAYTGIKPTIISETDLHLKPPPNPNRITAINVHYNHGSDEYDVRFQSGKKIEEVEGLQWDNLGSEIVRRMGVG